MGGTPKIILPASVVIQIVLDTLAYQEIFPQASRIGSQLPRRETGQNPIPHSIVIEINLDTFLQLVADIPAVGTKMKNHIGLFKQVHIALHGLHVNSQESTQFIEGNLAAHLERKGLNQFFYDGGPANVLKFKDIFVEIGIHNVRKDFLFIPWIVHHVGIKSEQEPIVQLAAFLQQGGVLHQLLGGKAKKIVFEFAASQGLVHGIRQIQGGGASHCQLHLGKGVVEQL